MLPKFFYKIFSEILPSINNPMPYNSNILDICQDMSN